jgi:hypothetical protein
MHDETGDLVGFVNITRDLTERQLAHQRLLKREQHYLRLIEAVVDYAVFQLDVDIRNARPPPPPIRLTIGRPAHRHRPPF